LAQMTVDVRVGIVSWNTADLLDRALGSVGEALGALSAEVVVVDNASTDSSIDVARSHEGVEVVVNEQNVGYARAMNRALADTQARTLIALNPDTEPPPGSLEKLVHTLDDHPGTGLVAPVLVGSDGAPQPSVGRYPGLLQALENGFVPPRWRRGEGAGHTSSLWPLRHRWVIGAVHCIRRAALGTDDAYSTRWFMYVEDIELCWRLEKRGWRNLVRGDVVVLHHGNAAGAQRWGEGVPLELQSLPNIYEWLRTDRSPTQARATALANFVGIEMKRAILRTLGALRGEGASHLNERSQALRALAAYHGKLLRAPLHSSIPPP
jgi:N-acetylglucosaminyl-diphospho-decaprenol L-rhamnosyltransferase